MNILIIKQTSLGDVLHATGHVKAVRRQYPDAHITLLTSDTAADIFRFNPHIDRLVEFQRYAVKDRWFKQPGWVIRHIKDTVCAVRERDYDLAIDLQGRWKSVLFLYACKSPIKIVKGRWMFLKQFRQRELHALAEMDGVLNAVGIDSSDTAMDMHVSKDARQKIQDKLTSSGWHGEPIVAISPFTRWPSKNWGLHHYQKLISLLPDNVYCVITGAPGDRDTAESLCRQAGRARLVNYCGSLDLQSFAALTRSAAVMISGDSFAMHLAVACNTPVIALFGPTDETRVGPLTDQAVVLRGAVECRKCYDRNCPSRCIDAITQEQVLNAVGKICPGLISSASNGVKAAPAG